MISVSYVYDTIQTLIRKDQKGNSFNISEFNRIGKLINYELYNTLAPDVGKSKDVNEALKDLMVMTHSISLSSGAGDIPADSERILGKPYVVSGPVTVDEITSLELPERLSDELTQPTTANPVCIIGGMGGAGDAFSQIQVYPNTITAIAINYLKLPVVPVLDFYINANNTYTYLDEGATGISVPADAVYSDGRAGPITVSSLTKNLEWHEHQTDIIISMILQKAGIILSDQTAIQYGIAKQTKAEQDD